jgi:hypothetical protein
LVALTHYQDRLGIEIPKIDTDVLWVTPRLPREDSGRLRAVREPIVEIPGNDQKGLVPLRHIANPQPAEVKSHRVAKLRAATLLDHLRGVKQRNEQRLFVFHLRISKSNP